MKEFSLLSLLANEPPKPKKVAEAVEPEKTEREYRVYTIEVLGESLKIGVPTENVDVFDDYFHSNPEHLVTISEHLEQFAAIVLE